VVLDVELVELDELDVELVELDELDVELVELDELDVDDVDVVGRPSVVAAWRLRYRLTCL